MSRNETKIEEHLKNFDSIFLDDKTKIITYNTKFENIFFDVAFDFLFIVSPTSTHFDYLKKGILKAKTIICDKPIFNYPFNKTNISMFTKLIEEKRTIILLTQRNMLFNFKSIDSIQNVDCIELNFIFKKLLSKIDFLESYLSHALAVLLVLHKKTNQINLISHNFTSKLKHQELISYFVIDTKIICLRINTDSDFKCNNIVFCDKNQKVLFKSIIDNQNNKTEFNTGEMVEFHEDFLYAFLMYVFKNNLENLLVNESITSVLKIENQFFE